MTVTRGWFLRQPDIQNAFLNRVLEEVVFMCKLFLRIQLPSSFVSFDQGYLWS
jgi:hypothetical protein